MLVFERCLTVGVLVTPEGVWGGVFTRELHVTGILETVRQRATLDGEETGATLM